MLKLEVSAHRERFIHADLAACEALILDVERSGPLWPGVLGVERLGPDTFRWRLEPRRTLGTVFRPEYVSRYTATGPGAIDFDTVDGNVETQGSWRLTVQGRGLLVGLRVNSRVEVPLPGFLRRPASLFARREVASGIDAQLARIKSILESPREGER